MWLLIILGDHRPWSALCSAWALHPWSNASVVMWIVGFGATHGTLLLKFGWWAHYARSSITSRDIFTQRWGLCDFRAFSETMKNWFCQGEFVLQRQPFPLKDSKVAMRALPRSSAKDAPAAMLMIYFLAGFTQAVLRFHSIPRCVMICVGESSNLSGLTKRPKEMQSFAKSMVLCAAVLGSVNRNSQASMYWNVAISSSVRAKSLRWSI